MTTLPSAIVLGLRQLLDRAVLAVLLKSVLVSLLIFAAVAGAGWFALDRLLGSAGLADDAFAGAQSVRGLLSLVLAVVGLWLTWRIVAMAVVQFFADDVVVAVERRHYPNEASTARDVPFAEAMRHSLSGASRALIANLLVLPIAAVLLVTGVGTFLVFWLVNAFLVGRELQDMVWLRHRHDKAHKAPVGRGERFLLGGLIAAMLAVPIVNFIAPVLGAAAATHLVHRRNRTV